MTVEVYGIRHHGPGSARALDDALAVQRPDIVLVEGPPEADALVPLAADPGMVPPVALLAYTADDAPARAAFWPFAAFSPEWRALEHALRRGVPVRFIDLPAAHTLAGQHAPEDQEKPEKPNEEEDPWRDRVRSDPLGVLAEAAGYDDAERWWDDVIELRGGSDRFAAVAEAMAALREGDDSAFTPREERREAAMRQAIRKALKEGHSNVAVVCGAWHVPALVDEARARVTATRDAAALKGLPKAKVAMTWVPWTHGRLTRASGYGAGVSSPGWYGHLFEVPDRPVERWLTAAARVLRAEGLPASSGHVIEAVRLAESLAVLRGRPLPGLEELTEAVRAVLCEGADLPVALVERRLVVGERLGAVPAGTPMVPLQRDLAAAQRRLRLRPSAEAREQVLDLRTELDLGRSRLLHRLRVLEVGWGEPAGAERGKGTFKETWTLRWQPEFDLRLIEAGALGTTVEEAAGTRVIAAATAPELPELTALAERCLLADLADALPEVMRALADRAATDRDSTRLMAALPPLVRSLRYGDVRGTPTGPLRAVVDGLVIRFCVGLPSAVSALDDDAAAAMLKLVGTVHETLALLDDPAHTERWLTALASLAEAPALHGVLAGRFTRLLLDAGRLPDPAERMSRAVSAGSPPDRAAAWIEGFLSDGALVLLHDEILLSLLDSWLAALPPTAFDTALPLLRRAFSGFASPERRALASAVRRPAAQRSREHQDLDLTRAAPAMATVLTFLDHRTPTP
ncbi:hypothetical protein EDD29_6634 [Actinocorallia herbida]|uniref:Uncharacterized protein n=1 Tax=Actinocorallia herbida TaxID=58109 RepID=A0A3N1D764_9ACTN|nr:DUF5682 family protein [Actinocorallia herbida]ROO88948.1 hypothetical protein EDD29_6634 [Actinocorallia herbida]